MRNHHIRKLQRMDCFARCSRRELELVGSAGTTLDVPAPQVLCREGERGRQWFVVLDGEVVLTVRGRVVGALRTGDWFGTGDGSDIEARYDATATSVAGATIMVFARREFRAVLLACPRAHIVPVDVAGAIVVGVVASPEGATGPRVVVP
jgi:CRP-like cAMP-binding protein